MLDVKRRFEDHGSEEPHGKKSCGVIDVTAGLFYVRGTGPSSHDLTNSVQDDDASDPDWGPAVRSVGPSALSYQNSSEPHKDYHLQTLDYGNIDLVDKPQGEEGVVLLAAPVLGHCLDSVLRCWAVFLRLTLVVFRHV